MSTIFTPGKLGSGTDMNTLYDEGKDQNHFLSLIVNNVGTYAAAITRKIHQTVIGTKTTSYNTFGNVPVGISDDGRVEYTKDSIEYYMLEIEKPVINTPKSELQLRIEELKKSDKSFINKRYNGFGNTNYTPSMRLSSGQTSISFKETPISPKPSPVFPAKSTPSINKDDDYDWDKWMNYHKTNEPKQLALFDENIEEVVTIESSVIKKHIAMLITCNFGAPLNPNVDLNKWSTNMCEAYGKIFNNDDDFEYYAEVMLDYLYTTCISTTNCLDPDAYLMAWAQEMEKELESLRTAKNSKYIDIYINNLNRLI